MSEIDVLKAMRLEDIESALQRWKKGDRASRAAVLVGRQLALDGGFPDQATVTGLGRAVELGSPAVLEIASLVLNVLVSQDRVGFSTIFELAKSTFAQGRLGAVVCIPARTPDALTRPILRALLTDRSKKVREMTVNWIRRHDLKQHLALLKEVLENEKDATLRQFMAQEIGLLADGYFVRRKRDAVYVTIKTSAGTYAGFIDSQLAKGLSDREIALRFKTMNP